MGEQVNRNVRWGAVVTFVLVSFGLAWVIALPLWFGDGLESPFAPLILPVMMFSPALATVLVMLVFRVPAGERLRFLGMWPLRPAKRIVWFMVAGLFAPLLIVFVGIAVSALLGLVDLDLVHFSGFAALLHETTPAALLDSMPPMGVVVALQLAALPLGAVINTIFTFGEELGWRGLLLPTLRPLGRWAALLLSGVIWGLWHAPVILLGYNFGRPDASGVLLMVGGCVAWGVLFGWSRLRTGSVWPAVIGHASLNAVGGALQLFAAANQTLDPAILGPVGIVVWAVIAVVVVVLVLTGQFGREPELTRRAQGAGPGETRSTGGETSPLIGG